MDVKSLLQSYRKPNNKKSNTNVIHYCFNALKEYEKDLAQKFYELNFFSQNSKDQIKPELVAPRKNKHIQHNNDITMVR